MNQVRDIGTRARPESDEPIPEENQPPRKSSSPESPDAVAAPSAPNSSRATTNVLIGALLVASFGAGACVLYFVADPTMRLVLGVSALLSVMWTSSYVGIIERAVRSIDERRRLRRYPMLRSRVAQILDEVKRMHWLVVDMNRGFRDEEAVRAEIEAIQRHLIELVESLPSVAGVERNGE